MPDALFNFMNHPLNATRTLGLAPMEGLIDPPMRQILTQAGHFDYCVTEFLRVVDQCLPERVFYRLCPELHQGGVTASGVPVHVQLLGSNPQAMAENAALVARLGAPVIDINFGCPAKTVNRNMGGAALLAYPERIYQTVLAVRKAVPIHLPVTAKMRLGLEHSDQAVDIALAIEAAGASWVTIHARTKAQGYRPSHILGTHCSHKRTVELPCCSEW
jgi:tRNA-dihydrouridine synthase C